MSEPTHRPHPPAQWAIRASTVVLVIVGLAAGGWLFLLYEVGQNRDVKGYPTIPEQVRSTASFLPPGHDIWWLGTNPAYEQPHIGGLGVAYDSATSSWKVGACISQSYPGQSGSPVSVLIVTLTSRREASDIPRNCRIGKHWVVIWRLRKPNGDRVLLAEFRDINDPLDESVIPAVAAHLQPYPTG